MLRLIIGCFLLLRFVFGGSPCPPRVQIYPCICIDRNIGKSKYDTTIICQGLKDGNSLAAIEPSLSHMDINTFLLYDSYWTRSTDSRLLQMEASIPTNHVNRYKINEVKIVDTSLSRFGCPTPDNCVTNYIKKFTAINTTAGATDRCNNIGMTINTWISCPGNIEELTINRGFPSAVTLRPDFFPESLNQLRVLRLPNNNIQKVYPRTFINSKFPILQHLVLSHNSLSEVKSLFPYPMKIEYLDLSHNAIRNVPDFLKLPDLKVLKLNDNQIVNLLEHEWNNVPTSLTALDLSNHNISCDCSMKFFNTSLPIHTTVLGSCAPEPPETANKKLRRASRLLRERCNEKGEIMATKLRNN